MIDYKYHVTSLAAVFLALGIGILIGSMAVSNGFIENQREALINRLEGDFQQLRMQNGLTRSELAAANNDLEEYKEICGLMMPALIKDKLQNYRVVIIQTNEECSLDSVINPLDIAGAKVEAVISVLSDFSLANANATISFSESGEDIKLIDMLGEAILFGDENGLLDDMDKRNLVRFSGFTGNSIDAVILAGGGETDLEEQAKWLDLSLADYFLNNNVEVIGVEPSTVLYSYMPYYQTKPIATIDNIESIPGQISLVYSILGERGNFGVKKTAKQLMPDLLILPY